MDAKLTSFLSADVLARPQASVQEKTRKHLMFSRSFDFFMIGGLGIALWFPFYFFGDSLNQLLSLSIFVPTAAMYAAYVVNHPHFMASYQLAYSQGRDFVARNSFQLVLVPILLISAGIWAAINWTHPISPASVQGINDFFASIGFGTRFGQRGSVGPEILALITHFMYFTVGWHYSKQTFGCMMVYAKYDGYKLGNLQRLMIRYMLLSTWWISFIGNNRAVGTYDYYGLKMNFLGFPNYLFVGVMTLFAMLFLANTGAFIYNFVKNKQTPSLNFLTPMFALLLWHIPLFYQPQYFVIIAFFHSLQYFPFVYKVEKTRYQRTDAKSTRRKLIQFFVAMICLGGIGFYAIPYGMEYFFNTNSLYAISASMIAVLGFINIHHYFIDNVLWRFKNKQVRELLL